MRRYHARWSGNREAQRQADAAYRALRNKKPEATAGRPKARGRYKPTKNGKLTKCRFGSCGGLPIIVPQVFKDGTKHYRSICSICGSFQGYVPVEIALQEEEGIPY
jgi:hypothetical protein